MPYIKQEHRGRAASHPKSPGELNFAFTALIKTYMEFYGLDYKTINDVLGALEGAKQEFYFRVALPYEVEKKKTNGDVY